MIDYPAPLKAVGGARTGIAPVNLLDVQDVNGNLYFWADRPVNAPIVITGATPPSGTLPVEIPPGQAVAWSLPTVAGFTSDAYDVAYARVVPGAGGSGSLTVGYQGPFTGPGCTATFSAFPMPALPPGAVIENVFVVAEVIDNGAAPLLTAQGGFTFPSTGDASGFYSKLLVAGPVSQSALATILSTYTSDWAAVDTLAPTVDTGLGLFLGPVGKNFIISSIGISVYYSTPGYGLPGSFSPGTVGIGGAPYLAWLLSVPSFSFYRSLQTNMGSFIIQNLSGDSLSRDPEKILRASALEGAFFVYRLWQPDAEASWIEVHGTLTVDEVGVDTITLKAAQLLNPSQDDTPLEIYCETCQIQWAGARCGSTQPTECSYSFQTCQVVERIMIEANDYEKNFGEASANTVLNVINRRRKI